MSSSGSHPRRLLAVVVLGALPTVVLDALLRTDATRLCSAWPLALLLALVSWLPACVLGALLARLHARGWALPLIVGGLVLGAGGFLSNVLLIDQVLDPATCAGYALATVVALATSVTMHRRGLGRSNGALAPALLVVAALLLGVDRFAFPVQYRGVHAALRAVATLLTTTAALGLLPALRARRHVGSTALVVALAPLLALVCLSPAALHRSLFARQSLEGSFAESVLQRTDARWFARRLGIRPCALGPNALSYVDARYTCPVSAPLSWTTPPEASGAVPAGPRPSALVLLTVDAFRCGLGERERAPFRDACPRLTELTRRDGSAHGSVQVSYPATRPSLLDLHCSNALDPSTCLSVRLAAHGYPGTALITHRQLQIAPISTAFAQWDETLLTGRPTSISSPHTAERTLARLRETTATNRFVWAHFLDPHDPYVPANGSHFSFDDERAYVDEIERTDRSLGTLLDGIEALHEPAVIVITGDHGEGFDEHGTSHHGYELYEPSVRVPFVAVAMHGAVLPRLLPRQSIDIAPYLIELAGGAPFDVTPPRPTRTERLWAISDGREKLILDRLNGRVELYDLAVDPDERDDVATARPGRVEALLAGLAATL